MNTGTKTKAARPSGAARPPAKEAADAQAAAAKGTKPAADKKVWDYIKNTKLQDKSKR